MKEGKRILLILSFVIISLFLVLLIDKINESSNVLKESSVDVEEKKDTAPTTVYFDGIGHYGFANAGSNNAYKGSYYGSGDRHLLYYPPSDAFFNNIRTNVVNSGYTFNNITGSKLDTGGGKIVKAYISYFAMTKVPPAGNYYETFENGRVLLIKPDGTYKIYTPGSVSKGIIEVTNDLNENNPDGYYYVGFLNAANMPHTAWALTVIYERSSLPLRYMRLLKTAKILTDGASADIVFNSKFALDNNYQLMGVILAGGQDAWANGDVNTGDKAWALLKNGSLKQLYQYNYAGRTIFANRSSTDFVNGTFNTVRNHNMPGGELDIFDETLSKDFFSNQEITGLRFQKTGKNTIYMWLYGIAQEVKVPGVSIQTKITPTTTNFKAGTKVNVTTTVTGSKVNNECLTAFNSIVTTSVDSVLDNPTNIVIKKGNIAYTATYNSTTRNITSTEIPTLNCSETITLTYTAVLNNNINSRKNNYSYYIDNNANVSFSLVNLNTLTGSEKTQYQGYRQTRTASDKVTSPTPATLVVKYVDQDGNNIDATQNINSSDYYYNQGYTTTKKTFSNYDFVNMGAGSDAVSGTIKKDTTTVTYVYKRKAKLIVNYYTIDSKNENTKLVHTSSKDVHYNDSYTTSGTTEGYNNEYYYFDHIVDENNKNITNNSVSGTIKKDTVEVKYFYKLKTGNLKVYHLIDETNEEIADVEEYKDLEYGSIYNTSFSKNLNKLNYVYYKVDETKDEANGLIEKANTEVIYYYKLRDSVLAATLEKNGPESLSSPLEKAKYEIKYVAEVKDYEGMAEIKLVDHLPYPINPENSSLDGGVYDSTENTITWEMVWDDIFVEGEDVLTKEIIKNIELEYVGIDGRDRLMNNKVDALTMMGSNKAMNYSEDISDTDIEIKGKIIVHHYLNGTTDKLFDDDETTELVGESYVSKPKEKEGYYLVKKPENENMTYEEEDQEVEYLYNIYKYKIITVAGSEGGTITGDEIVDYGSDSKEDNIIIEAKEGYTIKEIRINGETVEVSDLNKVILPNFKEVKEDKLVEVKFIVQDNPKTSKEDISFINKLAILFLLTIIIISFINKRRFVKL